MTKVSKSDREQAIARLREWIKPGDTVYTILRHVSRSGMQREIGVLLSLGSGDFRHPNHAVATALGLPLNKRGDGVKVGGAGMDMGYHLVHNLGATLFPDGFECVGNGDAASFGDRCPSNDHSNGDRDYTPHHHQSGGYALRHKWL